MNHLRPLLCLLLLLSIALTAWGKSEICTECNCFWRDGKKHVDCSYSGLTEIPAGLNYKVYSLSLQGNDIPDLGTTTSLGAEVLSGLKILNLMNNPITSVSSSFFSTATGLTHLMLHHTSLTTIPVSTFASLANLQWLWLNDNALTSIDRDLFRYNTKLVELYLQRNALTTVPNGAFVTQTSIKHIYLHENDLSANPDCCQMCGLPNSVDIKWGYTPQDFKLDCGCSSDTSCTGVYDGVTTTCHDQSAGECAIYVMNSGQRSVIPLMLTYILIAVVSLVLLWR